MTRRIAGYRVSSDVAALNPEILDDPTVRRAASADCADLLLSEAERLMLSTAPIVREWAAYTLTLTREYPFGSFRIDLADEAAKLAVEIDGGLSNARGGKHGTNRDYAKTRALVGAGWRLYRFTSSEVRTDPLRVLREIAEAR